MCYSVDQLVEVIRHAIEDGSKISEELVIQHTEFFVNEVCVINVSC